MNYESVIKLLFQFSSLMKEKISAEFKDKLIYLKIDAASKHFRSFIGINIQCLNDEGDLITRHLSCREMIDRHTAENLADHIKELLSEFSITLNQVFAITTDNASNMIKMNSLINKAITTLSEFDEVDDDDEAKEFMIINQVISDFSTGYPSIYHFPCMVHTLQLGINCFLKRFSHLIEKFKAIVRKMRTQVWMVMLKERNLNLPVLENSTRWGSTLRMMNYCTINQDFINEMSLEENCFKVSTEEWKEAKSIVDCLSPAGDLTEFLQKEKLFLTTAYIEFKATIQQLKIQNSHFSKLLVESLQPRFIKIHTNPAMQLAIFFDPRIKHLLTQDETRKIMDTLSKISGFTKEVSIEAIKIPSKVSKYDFLDEDQSCEVQQKNNFGKIELSSELKVYLNEPRANIELELLGF